MLEPKVLSLRYDSTRLPIYSMRRMEFHQMVAQCLKYKIPDERFLSQTQLDELLATPQSPEFEEAQIEQWECKE